MRARIRVKHKTDKIEVKLPRYHAVFFGGMMLRSGNFWDDGDYIYSSNTLYFKDYLEPGDILVIFGEDNDEA